MSRDWLVLGFLRDQVRLNAGLDRGPLLLDRCFNLLDIEVGPVFGAPSPLKTRRYPIRTEHPLSEGLPTRLPFDP